MEFERYNMQNRYAKLKKRRRNFYVDRAHHYSVIYDEERENAGSGLLKLGVLVAALTAAVWFAMQARAYLQTGKADFAEEQARPEEQSGRKVVAPKRKAAAANKKTQ